MLFNQLATPVTPVANANTFVLFGDSITSQCHLATNTAPTAISRSGDVVTYTASTNLMQVGQTVKVSNVMPEDFNGVFTVETVAAGNWTTRSAGTQGAATIAGTTHPSGGAMEVRVLESWGSHGMWMWVNGLMGGQLDLVFNCARGGWRASYMATTLPAREAEIAATGKTAANAYIRMGINDVINGGTAASIISALTTIVEHNKNMGRRVFLDTILPLFTDHSGFTAANNATIAEVNRWILKDAPGQLGVYPIDTYSPCVNTLNGATRTGVLSSGGVHPTPYGQVAFIAPAIAAVFSKYIPTSSILPASIVDTVGASANSKNLNNYGPWAATSGGTISGTVTPGTGGVCANFKVTETGAATSVAAQINTNTAGFIEQQAGLGGTIAAGDLADISFTGDTSLLTEGAKVIVCCQVEISNFSSSNGNARGFGMYIAYVAAGISGRVYLGNYLGTTYPFTGLDDTARTYTFVSAPITIPPSLTAFNPHWVIEGSGALAGSVATMKVSRVGFLKVN